MFDRLLLGVQKIELVGGESWFDHNSVAVAAVSAAALAALVAVLNQRAQLKHDRRLRNREHTRDTLDSAIVTANEMRTASEGFSAGMTAFENHRDGLSEADIKDKEEELKGERDELVENKLQGMRSALWRLEIRLKEPSEVVESYKATLNAVVDVLQHTYKGIGENRPPDVREGDDVRNEELASSFSNFQNACRDWFGERARRKLWRGRSQR